MMKDHGLLQAIARVNRVHDDSKDCGFVVDYVGVGNNLRQALDAYAQKELQEVIDCLTPASELIGELKQALDETLQILARNGLSETTETEAFYDLFYDEDIRFRYVTLVAIRPRLFASRATRRKWQRPSPGAMPAATS